MKIPRILHQFDLLKKWLADYGIEADFTQFKVQLIAKQGKLTNDNNDPVASVGR